MYSRYSEVFPLFFYKKAEKNRNLWKRTLLIWSQATVWCPQSKSLWDTNEIVCFLAENHRKQHNSFDVGNVSFSLSLSGAKKDLILPSLIERITTKKSKIGKGALYMLWYARNAWRVKDMAYLVNSPWRRAHTQKRHLCNNQMYLQLQFLLRKKGEKNVAEKCEEKGQPCREEWK